MWMCIYWIYTAYTCNYNTLLWCIAISIYNNIGLCGCQYYIVSENILWNLGKSWKVCLKCQVPRIIPAILVMSKRVHMHPSDISQDPMQCSIGCLHKNHLEALGSTHGLHGPEKNENRNIDPYIPYWIFMNISWIYSLLHMCLLDCDTSHR
jgi:hypothetical protein